MYLKLLNLPPLEDAQILSDEMMEQLESGDSVQCEGGCQTACKKSCKQTQRGDNSGGDINLPDIPIK